ncbi:1,4-dihydroxy-2-naphthoate polyprenyltransferase [Coraliomargarita sp. SDUM461004]|uniref:1,4-dihydroxy-2-naphthoate octaprenyltransferase n=1 Tax=Thalassobacterium sedimentorum TaxID=3041258 RepID=A0ABU1AML8_9BACT|nr:1,4-dihydroxy-2-naphthoate polyprenyltransferase [Coraliomargarita sp. SDUM461004]MDQ8195919.1 1,4-dihydroxy-2-naphthoate polyprenyltransferase [Coraliomargarita sp. SDUM461004]
MSGLQIWIEATRPKTLPAAVAPVLLGTAMAYYCGQLQLLPAVICLCFALLVQIGTNFANDYLDGVKGTDTDARLGPRRAVATGLITASTMKGATIGILAFAFCLGLSLIYFGGWWLLLIGIASVICAWVYTGGPFPLAYNGLGDLFVVLFFGLIAVVCTFYVQTGFINREVILLGLACGLVVNNILVVNNYRDIEEDRIAQKRTLVVLLGRRWALLQYGLSLVFAGGVLVWLVYQSFGSILLLGWLAIAYGFVLLLKLAQARTPIDFLAALKGAALTVVVYSALVSLGLFVSGMM